MNNQAISSAMQVKLEDIFEVLPAYPAFEAGIRRAPKRDFTLNKAETALALKNALRYIPEKWH
jgi:urocanate hydratase